MFRMRKTMKAYPAPSCRGLQALAFPHRPRCPIVGEACLRLSSVSCSFPRRAARTSPAPEEVSSRTGGQEER
jgi:hypothetical protein